MDIKTCGLNSEAAIEAALSRGASHVGFVFFEKSPRHLPLEEMARLRRAVGARALVTIVLVDPDDALLTTLAEKVRPDWLQLHGSETPERVAAIRRLAGLPVMKAISVGGPEDLARIGDYRAVADRILLDAKRPKGSELPGGNGVAFDWAILEALDPGLDYMLSGGLDAGNVAEAVRRVRPGGIDVSSGIESAPGVKDAGLIHRFFDRVEAALETSVRRAS